MKLHIFVIFLAANAALCKKDPTKRKKLIVPKLDGECKDIKCSAVDAPECLKVKDKSQKNRTMYIIMINKCEMQYMKCHKGFEPQIVPMKHCQHESLATNFTDQNAHKRSKRHVRVKRNGDTKNGPEARQATPIPREYSNSGDDEPSNMTGNAAYGHFMSSSSSVSRSVESEPEDYERQKLNQGHGGYKIKDFVEKPGYKLLEFTQRPNSFAGAEDSKIFLSGITSDHSDSGEYEYVSNDDCNHYKFFSVSNNINNPSEVGFVKFKIKTDKLAQIALTTAPRESNPMLEIIIGEFDNQRSVIKRDKELPYKADVNKPDLLNPNEFRDFWVSWDHGNIKVGQKDRDTHFMSWTDPDPFPIFYLGAKGGSKNAWKIQGVGRLYNVTESSPEVDPASSGSAESDDTREAKSSEIARDDISEVPMESKEWKHNDKFDEQADEDEYTAICPRVCPSREVMVCAKCVHQVYRTFMSVCHMRMYSCKNKDDALELVSRTPCVLSAPYVSDESMQPRGKITEDDDDDTVLRFIMCRDKGLLGTINQKVTGYNKIMDSRCSNFNRRVKYGPSPHEMEVVFEDSAY